jgi:gas vesicle protein
MSEERVENGGSDHRFRFFLYGGIVGTLAALLLAPKSGRETREMIADKAHEGKETVERGIRQVQETVKEKRENLQADAADLLNKAKNLTRREKETIMAAIEAGRNAYREEKKAHEHE